MNITASAAMKFMNAWQNKILSNKSVKTIICPPFTALYPISSVIEKISFELGAQNVYHEDGIQQVLSPQLQLLVWQLGQF